MYLILSYYFPAIFAIDNRHKLFKEFLAQEPKILPGGGAGFSSVFGDLWL